MTSLRISRRDSLQYRDTSVLFRDDADETREFSHNIVKYNKIMTHVL